jgi:hypothetical protein
LKAAPSSRWLGAALHESCFKKVMLKRIVRGSAMVLIACLAFSGCSSLSKSGRQQAAQRKYIRKMREDQLNEKRKIIAEKNRALSSPPPPSGWATNVIMDPAELPAPSPTESAASENTPAGN